MPIQTRFHPHPDGSFTVQRVEDVEPTLEWNKALQNIPQKSESFHHIASIPAIIIEKWCNEEGVNFFELRDYELKKFVLRKLNDPDWAHLKTTSKRL